MAFFDFINVIPKIFERNLVVERSKKTSEKIRKYCIPAYETAVSLYNSKDPRAENLKDYFQQIRNTSSAKARVNGGLGVILYALQNSVKLLNMVEDKAQLFFSDREISQSLTYTKATLLRLVDCAQYVEKYSREFLNFCYVSESLAYDPNHESVLQPRELKKIEQGFADFLICLVAVSIETDALEKHLASLPDAVVSKLSEDTIGMSKGMYALDPLNMRALSVRWNPMFWLMSVKADWDIASTKEAQAEYELLSTRLMYLKLQQEKKNDAKLQKEIDAMQERVTTLKVRLQEKEKEYAN